MSDETGVILTRLRELRCKTQETVALDLNSDQSTISAHERGVKPVGRKWLERYADYYHVSTDVIAGRAPIPSGYPRHIAGVVREEAATYEPTAPTAREKKPSPVVSWQGDHLEIRLPQEEEIRLRRKAETKGMTLSEYLAYLLDTCD